MESRHKLEPFLQEAHDLLMSEFGEYMGTDPRGHFDVSDPKKSVLLSPMASILGSFDAWTDCVSLTIEHDPLGTAVHELLHANCFADDWLPEDTGREGEILSLRGLEIQLLRSDRQTVIGIYHRGINEGVTELFTRRAYPDAAPAYIDLVPLAEELVTALGFERVANAYFREGYHDLEKVAARSAFDLGTIETRADAAYNERWTGRD